MDWGNKKLTVFRSLSFPLLAPFLGCLQWPRTYPLDLPLKFHRKFVKTNGLFCLLSNPLSFHLNTYNLMTRIQGAEVSHVFSCFRQELFLGRWHFKRDRTVLQMFSLFATSFLWGRAGKRPPGMRRKQQQTDENDNYCSLLPVHCNTKSGMFWKSIKRG